MGKIEQSKYLENLSAISNDIAQVSLATLVIPFISATPQWQIAIIGLMLSLLFWFISLKISLKEDNE